MPATTGTPTIAAARASVPPFVEDTHAPTPQALSDAAVKVRNLPYEPPTFEPPTKETRPFILADRGGYLTKEDNRAWLMGIEQMAKSADPYPSGTPGRGGSSRARSAARVWTGFFFFLFVVL